MTSPIIRQRIRKLYCTHPKSFPSISTLPKKRPFLSRRRDFAIYILYVKIYILSACLPLPEWRKIRPLTPCAMRLFLYVCLPVFTYDRKMLAYYFFYPHPTHLHTFDSRRHSFQYTILLLVSSDGILSSSSSWWRYIHKSFGNETEPSIIQNSSIHPSIISTPLYK